ncbi:hypothetical protein WA026_014956 [Henosepilachna vigintioctopunctata]|uniref:Chitobiosyldiphosphodolichol beta-mannosyltransferase n=1 Tax=Henosepilachna vigintioctopunctata TaxID=420089 RepID=A0AAW1TYR0_9CUCU
MVVKKRKNIKIVVLGDIGHSPRMTNHAVCLAEKGHTVDIIGYGDSDPINTLKLNSRIYYHYLFRCPEINAKWLPLKLLNYIFKTIWTTFNLLFLMLITRKSDMVLVQNPPAIPAMYVSWIYCKIIGAELVIDWHNYAHTIMAMSVGEKSPLVTLTKNIEVAIGRRADYNFCVSKAMKKDLYANWQIRTEVLYDRPSEEFAQVSDGEKHDFFLRLSKKKGFEIFGDKTNPYFTIFTHIPQTGGVYLKENRPAFIVSSTSWTLDEDFSILINALQDYEDHWQNGNEKKLPNLIVAITGKGPMKEYYCNDIESRKWEHIRVLTPWLDIIEYPYFIGSADLGISLHTSSSGLDLPMKIVDLFGTLVPVLAYNFKALNELVVHGKNGYVFSSSKGLSKLLQLWFEEFPKNKTVNETIEEFKEYLFNGRCFTWQNCWEGIAGPIF